MRFPPIVQQRNSFLSVLFLLLTQLLVSACDSGKNAQPDNSAASLEKLTTPAQIGQQQADREKPSLQKAKAIAQSTLIIDTHIDLPYRLQDVFEDVSQATTEGDMDYPRAVAGGLDAPFMSIFIPAGLQQKGGSKQLADELIDGIEKIVKNAPDKFALAYSTSEVETNFKNGIISLPMGLENGSAIEGDLSNLQHFYDRGIRYITLTHSKANHISDSSYDENRPAQGLTDFGKKLIVAMNQTGVMVDVSHISDQAFEQVMQISQLPVIASHSSARHFTPGFERNMSDEMIKSLASKGGVIQINFGSTFISQKSIDNYDAYKNAKAEFIKQNDLEQDSEAVKQFSEQYRLNTPFEFATLADVLDHFDHVVKLVGIDHVGIGSDFDGVGDSLPEGLKDVSSYPNLIQGLLARGYNKTDIEKVLSGNLLRVWKQVEAYAEKNRLAEG